MYVDGKKVVDNDGNAQSSVTKCGLTTLSTGLHDMYIEGWARTSSLSMAATYQGAAGAKHFCMMQHVFVHVKSRFFGFLYRSITGNCIDSVEF